MSHFKLILYILIGILFYLPVSSTEVERSCSFFFKTGVTEIRKKLNTSNCDSVKIYGEGATRSILKINRKYNKKDDYLIEDNKKKKWIIKDIHIINHEKSNPWRNKLIRIHNATSVTISSIMVENEPGRGVIQIGGENITLKNNIFINIGENAEDSSVIHIGNKKNSARNVTIVNNKYIGTDNRKTTFIDIVNSINVLIKNNRTTGGKKGVIISWPTMKSTNILIQNNHFLNCYSRCIDVYQNSKRLNKLGSLSIRNNFLTGIVGIRIKGRRTIETLRILNNKITTQKKKVVIYE